MRFVFKRVLLLTLVGGMAAAVLSACSGGSGSAPITGTPRTVSDISNGGSSSGSTLSASPSAVTVTPGASSTFVANSGSEHSISATVADPSCASVSPATQRPKSTGGGNHTATFTVTSSNTAGCSTTIALAANGNNTASVAVTIPAPTAPPWTAALHTNYVAIQSGGNPPQSIFIYAPGHNVPSATITYPTCCIFEAAFDANANLLLATTDKGLVIYAPGSTTPTRTLPAQNGFSVAVSPLGGDYAIGGYNAGPNVMVYPGGSAVGAYTVPGEPAFQALAFSPTGELAVPIASGAVQTYPHGSQIANRTLPVNIITGGGVNGAVLAYDNLGNLAVGDTTGTTVGVYAPGATTPSFTIPGLGSVRAVGYDGAGRLFVGDSSSIKIFAPVSATLVQTIPNAFAIAMAVDPAGDVAVTGIASTVFQSNGNIVSITGPFQSQTIAISP